MSTVPRLTERSARLVELTFREKPQASGFRVFAANTLTQAWAGSTAMFTVQSGGTYRSPGIRRRRLGLTQYSNRNLSRVIYDPEDFWVAGGTLPHDAHQAYLRVAEVNPAGTVLPVGPVFVVPQPTFFSTPRPVVTLAGTAPSVAASGIDVPPATAMHIVFPRFFDYCGITNKDGANDIFLSFNTGTPEIRIEAGASKDIYDAADSELLIRGDGGTADFDAQFAIVNGEMA
jgi:hypothetical protein